MSPPILVGPDPKPRWRPTLTLQLIVSMLVSGAVIFVGFFYYSVYSAHQRLHDLETATMKALSPLMTYIVEESMVLESREHISQLIEAFGSQKNLANLQLLDHQKRLVSSDRLSGVPEKERESAPMEPAEFSVDFKLISKPKCLRCHEPGRPVLGYLRVQSRLSTHSSILEQVHRSHLLVAFGSAVLLSLLTLVIVRLMILRPIHRLLAVAGRVREGDLDVRVEEPLPGELGQLGDSFNRMLERLEQDQREIVNLHTRQASQMDRLVSVGELAAKLAHEVRNPLTGIGSAIQVLRRGLPEEDSRREVLGKMLEQLQRMNKSMANYLEYARLPEAVIRPVNIKEPVERALFLVEPRAKLQKVRILLEIPPDLPLVRGDPGQLEQVALNLALNAVQAMPDGGELRISAALDPGGGILLKFKDTGPGIPPENINRVQTPFFTTRADGSGLGLPIVKQILIAHQGELRIESPAEGGGLMTVRLPIQGETDG